MLAARDGNRGVRHQFVALDAEVVQAGFGHVLRVGLQLGRARRKLGAAVARLVEQLAGLVQGLINLGQASPHLFRLDLQQAVAGLAGVALGIEVHHADGDFLVLGFAPQFLGRPGLDVQPQRHYALDHFRNQGIEALEPNRCAAMTLFERSHAGQTLRSVLRGLIAARAHPGQLFVAGGCEMLQFDALLLSLGNLHLQLVEQRAFLGALSLQPLQFLA